MVQSRTHTCNDLRMEHVGQQVKLAGWMENVREVGQNLAFVVLRDFYGTTQVVIETEEMMAAVKGLNKESTVSVEGVVRERDSKNPKLPTGGIEVVSCPTCGRTKIDLISLANQVETLAASYPLDIKVAVMGCVVNGPGEAKEADIGIAGGIGEGLLIKHGEVVRKVPEDELLDTLRYELENWNA